MAGIPPIEPYPMPQTGELPANTAPWQADPDRAVLLIHDMQRFFLRKFPAGEAPVTDLVGNAARLRESAVATGMPVAYTAQPGGMTEEQRGLLKDFWGPGMRVDPADREVVAPLAPAPDDWMLAKWRYSAFFRSDLLERMRSRGRDQLVLCGVYAHIGVLTTAVDAFTHDIQTFLVADAVADFTEDHHRRALRYAAERCAVVTTTKSLTAELER
ncbi:isochorismatase family protein [Streptomyces sp. NPDC006997]|uniref:isochorismatase family protein n=1 Tax=Streptomyces sp. NPDC006997 TaxID=3155356 RepID=UPI0033E757EA